MKTLKSIFTIALFAGLFLVNLQAQQRSSFVSHNKELSDLAVQKNISLGKKVFAPGEKVRFAFTVTNNSLTPSKATVVQFQLVKSGNKRNHDNKILGKTRVSPLQSKKTRTVKGVFTLPAKLQHGMYVVKVMVYGTTKTDANLKNNTAVIKLMIGGRTCGTEPTSAAKVIFEGKLETNKSKLRPGQVLEVKALLKNMSKHTTSGGTVKIMIDRNATLNQTEKVLTTVKMPLIKPNGKRPIKTIVKVPTKLPNGTYFIHAIVVDKSGKKNTYRGAVVTKKIIVQASSNVSKFTKVEKDNTIAGDDLTKVKTGKARYDLAFAGTPSTKKQFLGTGKAMLLVQAKVVNKKGGTSTATKIFYKLSKSATPTKKDKVLGNADLASIGPGKMVPIRKSLILPKKMGKGMYYLHMVIQGGRKDLNGKNNVVSIKVKI